MPPIKGELGFSFSNKLVGLVTTHGSPYEDRVVWVKLEGVEDSKIAIACICAPNIPMVRMHLRRLMTNSLPKIMHGLSGLYSTWWERLNDKSNDCGMTFSDLKRYCWGELLNAFQVQDMFCHYGGPRYLWNNGQMENARRLARPDRFYTLKGGGFGYRHSSYFIYGYLVSSNHSLVQNNFCIGDEEEENPHSKNGM